MNGGSCSSRASPRSACSAMYSHELVVGGGRILARTDAAVDADRGPIGHRVDADAAVDRA